MDSSGAKAGRGDIDAALKKLVAELAADKASLRRRIDRGEKLDADNEKLKPLLREVCVRARVCVCVCTRALVRPPTLFLFLLFVSSFSPRLAPAPAASATKCAC